jgi:hypothetical protein
VVLMFHPPDPALPLPLLSVLAGLTVLILHGGRLGARILDRIGPRRPRAPGPLLRDWVEDLVVLVLLLVFLLIPRVAGPSAAVGLAAFAVTGRPALRAARFIPTMALGIFRHLTRPGNGWREGSSLPGWVLAGERRLPGAGGRADGAGPTVVVPVLQGARAALVVPGAVGHFRQGWVLRRGEETLFVYRTVARSWEVELSRPVDAEAPGPPPWGRIIPVDPGTGSGVLLLPLDGPGDVGDRL